MIELTFIEIDGQTKDGRFRGLVPLKPGLNIFSQENAYGKSLAITAVPWCFGLEAMFGLQNCDPSRFPSAVRDFVTLGAQKNIEVLQSAARIGLKRDDGVTISLRRSIKGGDLDIVEVEESVAGSTRTSRLRARRETMADEVGGLQHFLYDWMGIPRTRIMTTRGTPAELYLENLAPLFYIDQNEGWTDLQALQVYRYQLQDVAPAAVEYLLGAQQALRVRFEYQEQVSLDARLKGEAEKIRERAVAFFASQGWSLNWSTHGSPSDISKRWSSESLSEIARDQFNMDPAAERRRLEDRISRLRDALASDGEGSPQLAPASQASQSVVDLKTKRHELRSSLRNAKVQHADQQALLETIEHRTHSSKDVLRLKSQGIGRLEQVECPTCHRQVDPSTFELSVQSTDSVQAHIDALQKERVLIRGNIAGLEQEITRLQHEVSEVEGQLALAERTLSTVNQAVGSSRERLAKIASDLAASERELDKLESYMHDIEAIEKDVRQWLLEVRTAETRASDLRDLRDRVATFKQKLREQLLALGHSAVTGENVAEVTLDERYTPYLGARRLRSLGSASDHARLVAAYVLALGEASRERRGAHPGIVILDEPLQQNPDEKHVELMLRFFETASRSAKNQILVTTYLKPEQIKRLHGAGVNAVELSGRHFLRPYSEPT